MAGQPSEPRCSLPLAPAPGRFVTSESARAQLMVRGVTPRGHFKVATGDGPGPGCYNRKDGACATERPLTEDSLPVARFTLRYQGLRICQDLSAEGTTLH